jgi:capsular polysaccharide biosynthesis protein
MQQHGEFNRLNEEVIRIEDIVDILIKRWKMILLITLIVTIFSAIISFFIISPKYEASTKAFIGKENTQVKDQDQTYNDVEMYQKLLKTYSEVIQTNDLVEKAVDLESLGLKSQDILDNLKVTPRTDTQILEIKYTSGDKVLARDILDSVTTEFIKSSAELIPNSNVKIIESVKIPEKPVSPNKIINIVAAFLLGLMISVGLSFLLEFIGNTFKNKEEMEEVLGLPVLGVIPDFLND